ncbi:MAG: class II fructose-bisphosphate aldolase [Clostridia bacterium]|nr:class II fructose-bisphosphate aldolase [Clostridia bacterium]
MLVGLKEVLEEGKRRQIAVANFNTPNLESLIAVLEAAEELDVPVIIAHAQLHERIVPIDRVGPMMVELAKRSKTRVCVHLDHGEDFEYCKRAIDFGFTSIMIDFSDLPYDENTKGTRMVTDYAHEHGVDVEGELGALPEREGSEAMDVRKREQPAPGDERELYTKPELVGDFLEKTNVDALAIAFGAVHGLYKKEPNLDMELITEITKKTDIPLVMHGGSGVSDEDYREVIRRGIRKINYYSYMAYAGYAKAKEIVNTVEADYYHNIGYGARQVMKADALRILKVFSHM